MLTLRKREVLFSFSRVFQGHRCLKIDLAVLKCTHLCFRLKNMLNNLDSFEYTIMPYQLVLNVFSQSLKSYATIFDYFSLLHYAKHLDKYCAVLKLMDERSDKTSRPDSLTLEELISHIKNLIEFMNASSFNQNLNKHLNQYQREVTFYELCIVSMIVLDFVVVMTLFCFKVLVANHSLLFIILAEIVIIAMPLLTLVVCSYFAKKSWESSLKVRLIQEFRQSFEKLEIYEINQNVTTFFNDSSYQESLGNELLSQLSLS